MGESRKRAAILAIFLGWLGIHKFYLKYTGQGLILLAIGISRHVYSIYWIFSFYFWMYRGTTLFYEER